MNNNDIINEFEHIDDKTVYNFHNYQEWHQCSKHFIKYPGVPGACPLCMVKTYIYEKIRIEEVGY
jgi:hypothetical protein